MAERGGAEGLLAGLTTGSAHCTGNNRVARGGTQGGLNCLTHVLPRCLLRRRLRRRMEEGPECCRRAEWPLGRRLERVTTLVPLLLTGVRQ